MGRPARFAARDFTTSIYHFQATDPAFRADFGLQSINVKQRLFLVGFSGTGKSTVARLVAARLGFEVVDTDAEIVRRFGQSIDRVFADRGEPAFRAAERELVLRATATDRVVVSVGGGAVADPLSRAAMLGSGAVVLLDASPRVILDRLSRDATEARPMLRAADPLARISELRDRRLPAYRQAHFSVTTDYLCPDEVADRIEAWYREYLHRGAR